MKNNPYIELVKNHEYIFTDLEKIYSNNGTWNKYFLNDNKLVLEIGTGLGNFFSKQVKENQNKNYLGMEIRYKRLFQTTQKCLGKKGSYSDNATHSLEIKEELKNFVMLKDFGENIDKIFEKAEVSETYIFFPDPWANKKSQLSKRLLQSKFLNNLYNITELGGIVVIKTDHREYFDFVLSELEKTKWKITFKSYDFEKEEQFKNSETTEFQQLFRGHDDIKINHLELEKNL